MSEITGISEVEMGGDISLVKDFFNENYKIEKNGDKYSVETILDNGLVDGGQNVKVRLELVEKNEKKIVDDYVTDSYCNFKITSLLINGQEIVDDSCEIFISNYNPPYENPGLLSERQKESLKKSQEESKNDYLNFEGDNTHVEDEKIYLRKIENGDDIATIFHEKGHVNMTKKMDNTSEISEKMQELQNIPAVDKTINDFKPNILNILNVIKNKFVKKIDVWDLEKNGSPLGSPLMFKRFIVEERQASEEALELMKNYNLFPNDKDLLKPKLRYAACISTYIDRYIREMKVMENINYKESLIKEKIGEIMDFNQKWDYKDML